MNVKFHPNPISPYGDTAFSYPDNLLGTPCMSFIRPGKLIEGFPHQSVLLNVPLNSGPKTCNIGCLKLEIEALKVM